LGRDVIDVVAVGHVLLDLRFLVDRFPGPDEEARIVDESRGVGGSAANVSISVRRLGLSSAIAAKVGLDSFARLAVDELLKEGVDISGLKISAVSPTGFSVVVRDSQGRIVIYGLKGASEGLEPEDVDVSLIERARFVHVASLRPDTTLRVVEQASRLGKVVSWDPGRVLAAMGIEKLSGVVRHVTTVLANQREISLLTGVEDYREAARRVKSLGPRAVIVKRGSEGAYAVSDEGEVEVPAFPPPRVVDTTGAGDAFAAGLIASLARGYSFKYALRYASLVAAIKVSRLGSHATPTHSEVVKYAESLGLSL
jgi:ribokinase